MHARQLFFFGGLVLAIAWAGPAAAGLTNGGFERGDLSGWQHGTMGVGRRSVGAPTSLDDLALQPTSLAANVLIVAGAAHSQVATPLQSGPLVPYAGNATVGLHVQAVGPTASVLSQSFAFAYDMVDPIDARLHLRLKALPVLQQNSDDSLSEPYFFVSLDNETSGAKGIASTYVALNGSSQPFFSSASAYYDASGNALRTPFWLDVHLLVPVLAAEANDVLTLSVVAANGNSAPNRAGAAYLDSVSSDANDQAIRLRPITQVGGSTFAINFDVQHGPTPTPFSVYLPPTLTYRTKYAAPGWACGATTETSGGFQGYTAVFCQPTTAAPYGRTAVQFYAICNANVSVGNAVTVGPYGFFTDLASAQNLTTFVQGVPMTFSMATAGTVTDAALTVALATAQSTSTAVAATINVSNRTGAPLALVTLRDTAPASLAAREWSCTASGQASIAGAASAHGSGPLVLSASLPSTRDAIACTTWLPRAGADQAALVRYGASVALGAGAVEATPDDNDGAVVFSMADLAGGLPSLGNDTVATPPAVCDASACGPYACATSGCLTSCTSDADCVAFYVCAAGGTCQAAVGVCTSDSDCPSGRSCTPIGSCESPATQSSTTPAWLGGGGCQSIAPHEAWPWALGWALARRPRRRSRAK